MKKAGAKQIEPAAGKAAQILDAAKHLFIAQGFDTTSMDSIAAEAGVSKATVYAHHDCKQALFAATIRRECERVTARMAIPCDVEELPLTAALERIAASFLDAVFQPQNLALLRMVVGETGRFPELGRIFYESAPAVTLVSVTAYFERMRDHGLLHACDCELAASQFLGALRGDVYLRALLGQPPVAGQLDAMAAEAVATFVQRYVRWPG